MSAEYHISATRSSCYYINIYIYYIYICVCVCKRTPVTCKKLGTSWYCQDAKYSRNPSAKKTLLGSSAIMFTSKTGMIGESSRYHLVFSTMKCSNMVEGYHQQTICPMLTVPVFLQVV